MTTTTFQLRNPLTLTSLQIVGDFNGGNANQGGTLDTTAGAVNLNTDLGATQILNGFFHSAAAGGGVALTLPTGARMVNACLRQGILPVAGTRLKAPMVINVTDGNPLTVTAPDGTVTVDGAAAINNECACVYITFLTATTYLAAVVNQT